MVRSKMIIPEIIKLLQSHNFYGAGEYTEIAKGKHELVSDIKGGYRKIKRQWLSRRKLK
jgi:hypothetical protein